MVKLALGVGAGLVAGTHAFWRMECPGRVGLARIDPIVNRGEASPHVHSIHGSSGFSEVAGYENLMDGSCTSCRVTQDKSSYWHPTLYFKSASTGQYEIVPQVGGMLAYYLKYGQNVKAFPKGFRMISGDTDRRTYTAGDYTERDPELSSWPGPDEADQKVLAQRAIGFNCLNYARPPEGTLERHYLPTKEFLDANCANGLRMEIMFPSCWKGEGHIDSPNHKDHVAFPHLVKSGDCPKDYSERLSSLLYEIIWNTAAFKGRDGKFVFSNDDDTGFGYHADFMTGWNETLLQNAIDTCTNDSGKISDCGLFNVVDESTADSCKLDAKLTKMSEVLDNLLKEDLEGPMDKLPGGMVDVVESILQPLIPALTMEIPQGPASSLGPIFKEKVSSPVATSAATVAPEETASSQPQTTPPPPAPTTEAPDDKSYYSTQYLTNGNVVSKIVMVEEVTTVTQDCDPTATASPIADQHQRRNAHLHRHAHGKKL